MGQRGRHLSTPLCPAGHLPRKGGDRMSFLLSPIANDVGRAPQLKLPISPLAGEMSGRTEGGVKERQSSLLAGLTHPKGLF
ncbi:hypothetical protein EOA13_27110 [Mesorhizobium sp. M7A.F.Ca.US.011.01.1.1]|nr:hypothetical protein EOA13_27110 [Mesorhizobium sp. M7A.F.Ca.US.011.01.1.1]